MGKQDHRPQHWPCMMQHWRREGGRLPHACLQKKNPFTEETNSWKTNSGQVSAYMLKINSPEQLICLKSFAFRPVCCLLFPAETTFFALFRGEEEGLRKAKKCFFGTFSTALFGGHFYYKTGQSMILGENVTRGAQGLLGRGTKSKEERKKERKKGKERK